jgi:hypothetical protein
MDPIVKQGDAMIENAKRDSNKRSVKFFNRSSRFFAVQIALLLFLLVGAAVGGSYAYMMLNTPTAANNFTVGIPDVTIVEPSVTPSAVPWGASTKPVYLSIPADSIGGVVRAMIIPVLTDASGNVVSTPTGQLSEPVADAIVMGDITLHFASDWETNWLYRDGYFYYRTVLSTGETTTRLLSGVTLTSNTPEMIAKYQNIVVEITVLSDVLQSNQDALANWGVTVDGSGNVS